MSLGEEPKFCSVLQRITGFGPPALLCPHALMLFHSLIPIQPHWCSYSSWNTHSQLLQVDPSTLAEPSCIYKTCSFSSFRSLFRCYLLRQVFSHYFNITGTPSLSFSHSSIPSLLYFFSLGSYHHYKFYLFIFIFNCPD